MRGDPDDPSARCGGSAYWPNGACVTPWLSVPRPSVSREVQQPVQRLGVDMWAEAMAWAITLAIVVAGFWIYGSMNSLHPEKTAQARSVALKLAGAPDGELTDTVRALTVGEFRAYFAGLRPPVQLNYPVEARTYGALARKWSQPTMFHRRNRALVALADVYSEEAVRLSRQG